jgi:competence protein ComFC
MKRHADREAAENAYGLGSADTQAAIMELLKHYAGGEPENLPGPEEFQECMERHPYADPDAVWTFLLFQPPPGFAYDGVMANPIQVEGAWRLGWALDLHTISSVLIGYDQNGREQFDTKRSQLGELVYQLKYRGQSQAADEIAGAMATFFADKPNLLAHVGLVVPMPASTQRAVQPVTTIASKLAQLLRKPFSENAIQKTKETPTLKSITDLAQRREVLDGAFAGDTAQLNRKGVLLVDDLYRSGSTANAVTLALIAAGASPVYFIAATKTRSNA